LHPDLGFWLHNQYNKADFKLKTASKKHQLQFTALKNVFTCWNYNEAK